MVKRRKVRKTKGTAAKARAFNWKAHWQAYKKLETKADQAWKKFRTDVKKKAQRKVLIKDQSNLLLLLGECNYMARECMKFTSKSKSLWR